MRAEVERRFARVAHIHAHRGKAAGDMSGGIHFCGDYVLCANTDGAVRSADLAARRVLDAS